MYERKIPEDLRCGIIITMKVIGGKWKLCIIDSIQNGVKRPTDMHKALHPASPRVINMQLAELQSMGVISKKVFNEIPLRVEYNLTAMGESLLPIIAAVDKWGTMHRDQLSFVAAREDDEAELELMHRDN